MNIDNLTDEEKRVKIAEACGWKAIGCTVCGKPGFVAQTPQGETLWRAEGAYNPDEAILRNCPDFLGSLDAMAQAEATLNHAEHYAYRQNLMEITRSKSPNDFSGVNGEAHHRRYVSATARQRADAFLLTKQ